MLTLIGRRLLDPDGMHAHFREDCPRVRLLHPGDMRLGFAGRRRPCPTCTELAERKSRRRSARAVKASAGGR